MKPIIPAFLNQKTALMIAVLTAIFCLAPRSHATVQTNLQMQLGNATGATANTNNHDHYLLQRSVEAIDYSDNLGEPVWASWDLTGGDIGGSGRNSTFYPDTNLPPNFYEVTYADYTDSGFDRGHMCPSEDRTDTTNDNKLVFFMDNIVPQYHALNGGPWETFEKYCQNQATAGSELLIMSGPNSFSGAKINTNGPAYIPGYTWKVAAIVPAGAGTALSRMTNTTRVIAVEMPNTTTVSGTPWTNFITSASVIQTNTGCLFFTALPTNVAEVLRAKVDGAKPPGITSFSPASAATGAAVTLTGSNFTSASIVKFNTSYATYTVNSGTTITATVPAGATSGTISVIAPGGLALSASSFTVTNAGGGGGGTTNITISQVYGGGGNSGATYINDFIEIYNAGTATVNLSTYAVQYASSTGSSWSETVLNGTIAPGHHYLIQEAAGTGGTTSLPTPEATGTISMSATAGKVALTKTTTVLMVSNPAGAANVADFVGYGSANAYEGTGPAPAPSATASDLRAGGGATDTNDNAADFSTGTVNPRNN